MDLVYVDGVLIAIHRRFQAYPITLRCDDSRLDQLCVCVKGSTSCGSLYLIVSYIPPNSPFDLYKAHADNIVSLTLSEVNENHICVLGDFNLNNVSWSNNFSKSGLIPNNISSAHESYFIDSLLSLNLVQINNFFNKLNKILDLIFVSDDINYTLSESVSSITPSGMHHVSLDLYVEFYNFSVPYSDDKLSFNYFACNFQTLDNLISNTDWDELLSDLDIFSSFSTFKATMREICLGNIPVKKKTI